MTAARSTFCTVAVVAMFMGAVATPAAATSAPIGPNQHYVGLVNGRHTGAVITVACPGPAITGRTGSVVGTQTVKVLRTRTGDGYTGSFAHEVWAQFGSDLFHVVGFTRYNVAESIPTSLRLPCQGTGTVMFTTCFGTLPCAANARVDIVTVTFVNIAA
jgi:hypothetical protein